MRTIRPAQRYENASHHAGGRLYWHDETRSLTINERVLPLTPTEYRLLRTFFPGQEELPTCSARQVSLVSCYVSSEDLQTSMSVLQRTLTNYVRNINSKLSVYDLMIVPLSLLGERGFLVVDASTLERI